jgi:hypothetical protein
MHKRFLVAAVAAALLLFGPSQGAFAHSRGYGGGNCGYDNGCSNRDDYGSSNDENQKWYDCRSDPYRDNNRYQTPCRYYEECTNYPRCKD